MPCLSVILCCYCLGTPNRYIQKCVASPVYEGTNLAKTTRSVISTRVPLSNTCTSQTSSLGSNHSSQSVSVQVVVCPPVTPPSPPPSPPPPPSFSPPPPSSLSLPKPPPPSLPLPSPPSPKGLSVPAGREPPNSPAMVGSPYERVLWEREREREREKGVKGRKENIIILFFSFLLYSQTLPWVFTTAYTFLMMLVLAVIHYNNLWTLSLSLSCRSKGQRSLMFPWATSLMRSFTNLFMMYACY